MAGRGNVAGQSDPTEEPTGPGDLWSVSGEREFFGDGYQDGGWVVAWPDGRPYSPDWVGKRYRTLVRATDLPYIRFHDLRHTWATLALEAAVPAKVVADRLGHAGIAITLDTYNHHVEHLDRDAADRDASLLNQP